MITILLMIKIALIVVLILESGFMESLERGITRFLRRVKILPSFSEFTFPKPFNCSLCLTFWCILGCLIWRDELTIDTLLLTLLIAYSTSFISDGLHLILDSLNRLVYLIRKILRID